MRPKPKPPSTSPSSHLRSPASCCRWTSHITRPPTHPPTHTHRTVSKVTLPLASVSTLRPPISCMASCRVPTSSPAADGGRGGGRRWERV